MKFNFNQALAYQIYGIYISSALALTHSSHPNRLVGVWSLLNATITQNYITTPNYWGPNPHGYTVFTRSGYFLDQINRSDLPIFPGDTQESGTPEDFEAVATGSLGVSGTYTVDANGDFESEIVTGSSFPNWIGLRRNTSELTLVPSADGRWLQERLVMDDGSVVSNLYEKIGQG